MGQSAARQCPGFAKQIGERRRHTCAFEYDPCDATQSGYGVQAHQAFFKKKRDQQAFIKAQQELEELNERARKGEIVLAYCDEVGFECVHPNRNAWTDRGQTHEIEATRGPRLNVIGAMLSTGKVFAARIWETVNADAFVGYLGLLTEKFAGKPITVVLDNASVHKRKDVKPLMKLLASKGLTLYFLPAYSPELNRIERLWHKIKHTWMVPKCRDKETLYSDVGEIFDNFGSKYEFAFYSE